MQPQVNVIFGGEQETSAARCECLEGVFLDPDSFARLIRVFKEDAVRAPRKATRCRNVLEKEFGTDLCNVVISCFQKSFKRAFAFLEVFFGEGNVQLRIVV